MSLEKHMAELQAGESIRYFFPDVPDVEEVVLFGAGGRGVELAEQLAASGIRVGAFLDNAPAKDGTELKGAPVCLPEKSGPYTHLPLLITSYAAGPMFLQAKDLGFRDIYMDVNDGEASFFSAQAVQDAMPELERVYSLMADDRSRYVFASLVRARLEENYDFLPVSAAEQYEHPEAPLMQGDCVFDCGAFFGDTALKFLRKADGKAQIHCFEINPEMFQALCDNGRNWGYEQQIVPVQKGVWDTTGVQSAPKSVMALPWDDQDLDSIVEFDVTTIDDYVQQNQTRVNCIKMDVEGAEYPALLGAEKTLREQAPELWISIYHCNEDLYRIALYLAEVQPKYKFYMEHHGFGTFCETVLYASAR